MNKSLLTNLLAAATVSIGIGTGNEMVLLTGMFALSGAITNWLAIYMLFERVPGLYGSGVIPTRFEEFKAAIHGLIMGQFFTADTVERLLSGRGDNGGPGLLGQIDTSAVKDAIDYDVVFEKISSAVLASSFGSMLNMFGGAKMLEGLRDPVQRTLGDVVEDVLNSPDFSAALASGIAGGAQDIVEKVDHIVQARLDELTPDDVKRIVQEMIREHLGWLVVWGGVFGAVIGLITSLLQA
ncbi:MAG: DUF445 domain-containing protein [Planctomycetes bacterium]|nr:DUF445 domain-containing protein [Planctomycetota bacterium]